MNKYSLEQIIEAIEAAGFRVEIAPRPHPTSTNHGGYQISKQGAGVVAGLLYDFRLADLEEWARERGLIS